MAEMYEEAERCLRRAHWHTFRVGKNRQGIRVRWLHPILVGYGNADGEEDSQ